MQRAVMMQNAIPGEDTEDALLQGDVVQDLEFWQEECKRLKLQKYEYQAELDKVARIWEAKISKLEEEIEDAREQVASVANEIQAAQEVDKEAPGPECLSFVDGDVFMMAGMVVVVGNIITILLQAVEEHYVQDWYALDQAFLLFYIVELSLRAAYHQSRLLFSPTCAAGWNWLDLVIVLTGVLVQWVLPLFAGAVDDSKPSYVDYLRVLRLARLMRALRLIKVFVHSDMHWADGDLFESFIMVVIGLNAILMGLETEFTHWAMWKYINHVLLLIFTFELLVRFKRRGCRGFFCGRDVFWNYLDFIIVVGGALDQWVMPLAELAGSSHAQSIGGLNIATVMNLLRMARLLRILRLMRLIKSIPQLYTLVLGVAKAMQGMAWVMVLTVTVLYVCALLGCKMLGPEGLLWHLLQEDPTVPDAVSAAFPDLWGGVFNLFKMMNGDFGWAGDLFLYCPMVKFVAMFYVVVTNWAIFSILTAVVSENMARATDEFDAENSAFCREMKNRELVNGIFEAVDLDASGDISERELKAFLSDNRAHELCKAADLNPRDVQEIWDIYSHKPRRGLPNSAKLQDEKEEAFLTKEDFIEKLIEESSLVKQRAVMRVEKRLGEFETKLTASLAAFQQRIASMARDHESRNPNSCFPCVAGTPWRR